ncbi:hypothetical protein [Enterococcus gilvus]|uniref:hypothetical protein n=1 Tax=Enterococcus gilvus TaxID=160453 RepID=UPI003EDADB94
MVEARVLVHRYDEKGKVIEIFEPKSDQELEEITENFCQEMREKGYSVEGHTYTNSRTNVFEAKTKKDTLESLVILTRF